MKKLDPLEADHIKLKANFTGYEISLWLRNFEAILHTCEMLLSASRYL